MNTEKQTKLGISRKACSLLTKASLAFALLMTTAQQALALNVATMPSNSQNPSKGLAQQNASIQLFGRAWDVSGVISATIDPGDGTGPISAGSNASFLAINHTYSSFGVKTVTLSVTDNNGTVSKTAKVKVLAAPAAEERINMAIEKGLIWLYRNQNVSGRYSHWQTTGWVGVAITGAAVMAFEENGHLPGNTDTEDIYAETTRRGIDFLLAHQESTIAYGGFDLNGNGRAGWISSQSHAQYSNSYGAMALFLSQPDKATAETNFHNDANSAFNGMSYYDIGVDILDNLSRAQSDHSSYRGSWHYFVNHDGYNAWDGSTHQWPCLAFVTAQERWGIQAPQSVKDNAYYTFLRLQYNNPGNFTDGSIGYSGPGSWPNTSKGGGIMVAGAWLGYTPDNDDLIDGYANSIDRAIAYLGRVYYGGVHEADHNGPVGNYYASYGFKKAFALQGIDTINTAIGIRDWYKDLSSWILGDPNLWSADGVTLPAQMGGGTGARSIGHMYGQQSDGRWNSRGHNASNWVSTAHAILILTQAVTIPLPVSIVATIGDNGEVKANNPFQLDGTQSYHQDGDLAIVSYNWVINQVGGANNPVVAASGATPIIAGLPLGKYEAVLTVTDNNPEEAQTAMDTSTFFSVDKNFGPVSVPIPSEQLAYTAQVVQGGSVNITLDGSGSSDPEGDAIISYNWDLDGDGEYDDATGANPTIIVSTPGSFTIALEVCSQNQAVDEAGNVYTQTQCSTDNAPVQVIYSASDLYVVSIEAANIVQGVQADVSALVANDVTSGQGFTSVKVRFFDGDPDNGGLALAPAQTVDLAVGASATVSELGLALNPTTELVWVKVDWAQGAPTGQFDEWDEDNNTASVNVSNQPPVLVLNPEGFSADADGNCQAVITAAQLAAGTSDPDGDDLTITADPAGPYGLGTTVVTVTVTDGKETVSGMISVTVTDLVPPVLVIPADQTLECPVDTSVASTGSATATDNCSVDVSYKDVVTETCGSTHTVVRTWTAIDGSGNSVSGDQFIVVQDTTAPALVGVPADVTVECDSVPALASVSATDACDTPNLVFDEVKTDGNCIGSYTLTRTWTATDACGNVNVATQFVTVEDTTAPVIASDAADITPADVPVTFQIAASDNCDVALAVIYSAAKTNEKGKITDKTADTIVEFEQADSGLINVTIVDAGGNGNVVTFVATATDGCNSTITIHTVNVVSPSSSEANEGVGNGVDGNTPGHDNNGGNDDPGNTPGNPGAKGKKK
jgi:hypothetical protein